MSQLPLFSSGIELANLVVSSGILKLSWDKISELSAELNQNEEIRFKVYQQQQSNCIIVAFVVSPNCTKQLLQEKELAPSSSLPFFHFLRTKINSSFSINKTAVTLFDSVRHQLSSYKDQPGNSISLIITGHCLGGSVASLFTLWLLESFNRPGTKHPLCITFGAPLIGDKGLQQAISQHLKWNSSFLHVAANQDLVPRFFISPYNPNAMEINSQTGIYKPFGVFLLCSEYGCTPLEDPEAVSEVLVAMGETPRNQTPNEQWHTIDYGTIVECLMSTVRIKGISQLSEMIECPLRAGIVLQLEAIGLNRRQQSGDSNQLIVKLEKWEEDCVLKRKMVFDPFKKLSNIKLYMANLEWYKKVSKSEDRGYYDSYKNRRFPKDMEVVKFKRHLTKYWEKMVAEVERMPQKEEASFRTRWLYAGLNYRRMVEPLDIAEYYKDKGLKDYKKKGRSQHYIKLEQWVEEAGKPLSSSVNSKKQNVSASLTEDSCFWAHVEEALIQCKLLRDGQEGEETTRKNLFEFEEYVMERIKKYAVSPEIFLGGSSFMQWWKDYEQIIGTSYKSQLTDFMKNRLYQQYHDGSLNLP